MRKILYILAFFIVGLIFIDLEEVKAEDTKWEASFYPNFNLSGTPIKKSYDSINFNWGWDSPAEGIPSDYFSATFKKNVELTEGIYNFRVWANDGVQVIVDGNLIIDQWNNNQGLKFFANPVYLKKGKHTIEIRYREVVGVAELRFEIDDLMRDNRWYGMAFENSDFTGNTALLGYQPQIFDLNFNWGWGSPAPNIPSDNFSTIFQRKITVNEGAYNLRVYANDGVQVYVDGKLEIDEWDNDQGLKFFGKPIYLSSGTHTILIKHKELVGVSELRFEIDDLLRDNRWYGLAFPTIDLSGTPVLLGYQPQIPELKLNWAKGSPSKEIPNDNFSTLFQRKINVNEGIYNIKVRVDDGVRVYVDGKLELDHWNNTGVNTFDKQIYLSKGIHTILIKHKELTGDSLIEFDINPIFDDDRWYGMAFSNPDLTGNSILLGFDEPIETIDFNWEWDSPGPGIPSDYFSTIFQRNVTINQDGIYNIEAWANDGVQVFVDGKLFIDQWNNSQGLRKFEKEVFLKSGKHQVIIKHKELVGVAELRLNINMLVKNDRWYGMAFSNPDLTGNSSSIGFDSLIKDINFNWGWGSPAANIPTDNFSVIFQRKIMVNEGAYNLRVWANDGVQVYVDGKLEIDEWDNDQGLKFFGKPVYLKNGEHTVVIKYKELVGVAELRFEIDDLLRDNRWYGLAFANPDLSGEGTLLGYDPHIYDLNFNWGWDSPAPNIPTDNFSTLFQRKITVNEGAYNLRVYANDGVQVYVDGKLEIDEWDNDQGLKFFGKPIYLSSGTHTILIKHKELVGVSELRFEIDDLLRDNRWYGLAFPTKNFTGTPVLLGYQPQIPELDFDWGSGSPAKEIPVDNFSTIFQRYINTGSGDYQLNVWANDGVRVYIDGKLVLDQFTNKSENYFTKVVNLKSGKHHILVKYFEETGVAKLKVDLKPKKNIETVYKNYDLTLEQMVNIQNNAGPLTDIKYKLWVREDAFVPGSIKNGTGLIKDETWNLRRGPGTQYMTDGTIRNVKVSILGSSKDKEGYTWYHVKNTSGWVKPNIEDLRYYINPNNFVNNLRDKLMFMKLSSLSNIDPTEINQKILNVKEGSLYGRALNFVQAGEKHKVNEIYLIAHAVLETGNGTSYLANGSIEVGEISSNKWVTFQPGGTYIAEYLYDGQKWKWVVQQNDNFNRSSAKNIKKVYNMFGIGAFDSHPETLGAIKAYTEGWFTPEKAIEGGARFIAEDYIKAGQDTLYKMRWNPDFAAKNKYASHQYASDIGWAYKQTSIMYNILQSIETYSIIFEIPKYKN